MVVKRKQQPINSGVKQRRRNGRDCDTANETTINNVLRVTRLGTKTRSGHSYQGNLMTAIEDENQRVLLHNSYMDGIVIGQDFGNGRVFSYSYEPSASGTYAETVDVTSPDGTTIRVAVGDSVSDWIKEPR